MRLPRAGNRNGNGLWPWGLLFFYSSLCSSLTLLPQRNLRSCVRIRLKLHSRGRIGAESQPLCPPKSNSMSLKNQPGYGEWDFRGQLLPKDLEIVPDMFCSACHCLLLSAVSNKPTYEASINRDPPNRSQCILTPMIRTPKKGSPYSCELEARMSSIYKRAKVQGSPTAV